jgi:hypothetical protein
VQLSIFPISTKWHQRGCGCAHAGGRSPARPITPEHQNQSNQFDRQFFALAGGAHFCVLRIRSFDTRERVAKSGGVRCPSAARVCASAAATSTTVRSRAADQPLPSYPSFRHDKLLAEQENSYNIVSKRARRTAAERRQPASIPRYLGGLPHPSNHPSLPAVRLPPRAESGRQRTQDA